MPAQPAPQTAQLESPFYVEAPEGFVDGGRPSVFLAGGITGCPDWQREVSLNLLGRSKWVVLNPRCKNFPIDDPTAARAQITWEHECLRQAQAVLFWFPCETLCPIVLYELGTWSRSNKPIFVGTHPDYARRRDVEIQTQLVRPEVHIVHNLGSLTDQVVDFSLREQVRE